MNIVSIHSPHSREVSHKKKQVGDEWQRRNIRRQEEAEWDRP